MMRFRLSHTRRTFTSPGADPWTITVHQLRYGPRRREIVRITDGPALVANVYLGRRELFISEVIHPRLHRIVRWLFDRWEAQHEREEMQATEVVQDLYYRP